MEDLLFKLLFQLKMVDKFDCWESSVPENLQEINLSKNV